MRVRNNRTAATTAALSRPPRPAADVAKFDHTESAGRDRERRDQPPEREDGERLGRADLMLRHPEVAQGQQEDEEQRQLAEQRGPGQPDPSARHQVDRVGAELRRAVVHPGDGRLAEHAPDGREHMGDPVADATRERLALEDRRQQDDGRGQDHEPDQGGRDERGALLPRDHQEHDGEHRERQLHEDVPDTADAHVEGDRSAGEPPRMQDRVRQSDRDRAATRQRVGDRCGRLGHDRRRPKTQAREGGHVRPPVREEVEDRGGDERPHLDGREGGDRLPHLGVVRELGDRVDEDPDHDQEGDGGRDVTPDVALGRPRPLAHQRRA